MRHLEDFRGCVEEGLKRGPVLVCYLDGLGYEMYRFAKKRRKLWMESAFETEPVLTVEPPLTNAAMATMLTGCSPEVHKIRSHHHRMLTVPTIFDRYDGKSVLLEGDTRILHLSQRTILHTVYGGKSGDDHISEDVLRAVQKEIPFIFAHFHEIDDAGHRWGPYSEAVLDEIGKTDDRLRQFRKEFAGEIYVISDHGMYEKEGSGVHGEAPPFRPEEMTALWGVSKKI